MSQNEYTYLEVELSKNLKIIKEMNDENSQNIGKGLPKEKN
jgi:hypothetical protein